MQYIGTAHLNDLIASEYNSLKLHDKSMTTVITQNQKVQNSELKWWTFGSNCTIHSLHILMYYNMNGVGILTYSIKEMELL
jgi:hypothetical protein